MAASNSTPLALTSTPATYLRALPHPSVRPSVTPRWQRECPLPASLRSSKDIAFVERQLSRMVNIASDYSLGLERQPRVFEFLWKRCVSTLMLAPALFRSLIVRTNKSAEAVLDNVTTHAALEVIYANGEERKARGLARRLFQKIWFNTNNTRGVRNRLILVRRELVNAILEHAENKDEIVIASIAAGSSRAVIEALEAANVHDRRFRVYFVDKSPAAIAYSKKLVAAHPLWKNINYEFFWIEDTVTHFLSNAPCEFSIVEMVGLMDYFADDRARAIFAGIRRIMKTGGHFITANINDNWERAFVTRVVGWKMIYRSAERLARLVYEAGFSRHTMNVFYEPLKVHSLVVARKR